MAATAKIAKSLKKREIQGAGAQSLPLLRPPRAVHPAVSECGRICFRVMALKGEIPAS